MVFPLISGGNPEEVAAESAESAEKDREDGLDLPIFFFFPWFCEERGGGL